MSAMADYSWSPPTPAYLPAQQPNSGLTLRAGRRDEAAVLSDLALRSTAWWEDWESFPPDTRDELTLDPDLAEHTTVVEVDGRVAGFYRIDPLPASAGRPGCGELSMLFVDPDFVGSGVGRVLVEDARRGAGAAGWSHLLVCAEPHATPFYQRLGAEQVDERPGATPGCNSPIFLLPVRRSGGSGGARAAYWR